MVQSVTSWFIDQSFDASPPVKRKFTIGTSDYSSRVIGWPQVTRGWNDIRPLQINLRLANEDKALNFFISDKTNLRKACDLSIGFTHPTSGDELVSIFAGTVQNVGFAQGAVNLTITDKFKQFSERKVGTNDAPVVFSGGTFLPSDVAWSVVTSYGGFSSIASTSNPDINYQSFLDWANVFSSNNVFMDGLFKGQKTTEALRKIGRHTQSAIFIEENKLYFRRFSQADSGSTTVDNTTIKDLTLSIADADMVNKQYVLADYDPTSKTYGIEVVDVVSASVNSYGVREQTEKDESVWYVNSVSAISFAQRVTSISGDPFNRLKVKTTLATLPNIIGDTLVVTDDLLDISAQPYRIMGYTINAETGQTAMEIDESQLLSLFTLDVSSLDGTDVLG